ncbi:MAG: sugar ABC transporter substrate-binding protein [bacterium]|nr:sugar ABC transporter substrate-binding protein [bacterium]
MNEENTIFQPAPQQPLEAPLISPTPNFKAEPPLSKSSPMSIVKLLVGGLVLIIVVFIAIRFILPYFQGSKNEEVKLTYWGLWENENTMKVIISDFNRQNLNITIDYSKQDIKQYRERLATRIQNGTGPDIFQFHNTWLPMFFNVLVPLPENVMPKNEFGKIYYPVVQTDLVKQGAIYGIPTGIDTLSLFVNTDILKAAGTGVPKTWDEFLTTARTLTVKGENGEIKTAGTAMGTFDNITHASDIVSLLFVQNGAYLNNLSDTLENASEALRFYASFANDEAKVWDETLDPSRLAFAKGNLAMYFGYSWDIFAIKALNPELPFEIHSVPALAGRNITIASYFANGVSIKSKHQKEALLFMNFLAKRETQQKLFSESSKTRLFGEPYARIDLANSLKDNSYVYPFVEQGKSAVSTFFASDTFDNGLNDQMNQYLGNAVRSVLGNTSPQSAIETLASGVKQVLGRYNEKR